MSGSTPGAGTAGILALSVHGPRGVVDLVVPDGASAADVAVEYAEQARLTAPVQLCSSVGRPLPADLPLLDAGVASGAVLVAVAGRPGPAAPGPPALREPEPEAWADGAVRVLGGVLAVGAALLAAWSATGLPGSPARTATLAALLVGAVLGCLPVGRPARPGLWAAPWFAAAAAWVVVGDLHPQRLPVVVGLCALAAAVTAAVGRALADDEGDALLVWVVAGTGVFVVTGAVGLAGGRPQVAWALLLLAAMLAARFVPVLAVEVPDQFLIDIERLAVTAWSARERPTGRRGRTVVPRSAVAEVAARGSRRVTAAGVAVLAVVAVSAPLLLATATLPLDRVGARCLVGLVGAALVLAARSHRHAAPRALLRAAGLACGVTLLVALLPDSGPGTATALVVGALLLGAVCVVVAVASGRGWRSPWWARRAEVAEAVCGAFAIAALVPAVGLFRHLWELTG